MAVAFLYGENSSFITQQLTHLLLMRRMYLNLERVIILRYSTCQLCPPQTQGFSPLIRDLVAELEKQPWGRGCSPYQHVSGS